jgi:hypothetical protein
MSDSAVSVHPQEGTPAADRRRFLGGWAFVTAIAGLLLPLFLWTVLDALEPALAVACLLALSALLLGILGRTSPEGKAGIGSAVAVLLLAAVTTYLYLDAWSSNGDLAAAIEDSSDGGFFYFDRYLINPHPYDLSFIQVLLAKRYVEKHPDMRSHFLLRILRRQAPEVYYAIPAATRASILCDVMERGIDMTNFLNPLYPEPGPGGESADALLETGDEAKVRLAKLLTNTNPAHISGEAVATVAIQDHHRRCDYAYWNLMLLLGRKYAYEVDREDRDRQISTLRAELGL